MDDFNDINCTLDCLKCPYMLDFENCISEYPSMLHPENYSYE